ncbi:MAG: hypothetical protein AAGF74_10600 [Pseudomonadota bacterium]
MFKDPRGADWADHDGVELIRSYWVEDKTAREQARLGLICPMREAAWFEVQRLIGPE